MTLDANAGRFSGFADLYDAARPVPPDMLAEMIVAYAVSPPDLVVDLGSGTGLSTRWAAAWAAQVVGVEPSRDMRARAASVTRERNVEYLSGWSHATGLPDSCADVVLAVQALHWMDPTSTFAEVARILRPGGVFAAIDCDWPPSVGDAHAEQAWHTARATVAARERELAHDLAGAAAPDEMVQRPSGSSPQSDVLRASARAGDGVVIVDGARYWNKSGHLARMVASGRFRHCVEVGALSLETGDAARFVELFRSQGDYQALVRHGFDDHALGVDQLVHDVHEAFGPMERTFWFAYRARIGVC